MPEVFQVQTKLTVGFGAHQIAELFDVTGLAIRREAHDFPFVAVIREAEKLCGRRVQDSERVRILDLAQHLDRIPFSHAPHGRDKIAKAIQRNQRRPGERRNEEGAGQMRAMMLDVVKRRSQFRFGNAESHSQFIFHITNFRCVTQAIGDLP